MKAYKIEILVIDHDSLGEASLREELVNANFPNDCISLDIKSITEKDVGEWHDEHPLNKLSTCDSEYRRLFSVYSFL
jgi:hypothetical protein